MREYGQHLDEIIFSISPTDDKGSKLYLDTEDFEREFIKGQVEQLSDNNYLKDQKSIEFVNALLDYLESGRTQDGKPYGGSVLTDLKESYSPLDQSKECTSDFLYIVEKNELIVSTYSDGETIMGGGRSISYGGLE